jgi:predicted dehydrogenase
MYVCSDLRQERLNFIARRYPGIKVTRNHSDVIRDSTIEAIALATPVDTHFPLAYEALMAGKDLFIEKPLTASTEEALQLIELAEERDRVLMVGHTFLYTGAVRKIKEIISSGSIGDIYYFDSIRINLGLFQPKVNVIWDLAPHDISIMDYILEKDPLAVSATGACHTGNGIENLAYLTIHYPDNLLAHIHINWLAPVKIRKTLICGSKKMIIYDDLEPDEKVKIYDRGIVVNNNGAYQAMVEYRIGDMYAPKLDRTEALKLECNHFIECIKERKKPLTDGMAGLRTVWIIEAAQLSLKEQGRIVELTSHEICSERR